MTEKELIKKFNDKPYLYCMGAGSLAKRYKVSRELIYKIKNLNKYKRVKTEDSIQPKVLIFDIETTPMKAFVWRRWKQNIRLDHTISEWYCLCWSAKWLYNANTMYGVLTPSEALEEDDERIMSNLWELFDEADIVIAHNGLKFDIPRLNSRWISLGKVPPSSYRVIDTCKVAQKQFGFSSNKLDALAGYFGISHKLDTEFDLWVRCMRGERKALAEMSTYNIQDTRILEEVYLRLAPWIKDTPNFGMYGNDSIPVCANCGSTDLVPIDNKYYITQVGKYQLYRCKTCGAISRGRVNLLTKDKRATLLTNIAK